MSIYTTGEIAKLCGVSVRTVQYYDDRGILIPSELSEGGRRLYSDDDLKRMHIICFLREAGFPINSISALFAEENPESIISILIDQQESALREELAEHQKKLDMIEGIKKELKEIKNFSVNSLSDIALIMKEKKKLAKVRLTMILTGIPLCVLQWISVILWITHGFWWMVVIWACIAIPYGIAVSIYYFKKTKYICPTCHNVFKPKFGEMFWAYHTPKMRRLTCPKCGKKGLCIEVYANEEDR